MKMAPDLSPQFAIQMAIALDLPMPVEYYSLWMSRSRFFELRNAGAIAMEKVNGHACVRPSEFRRFVERGHPNPPA